MVDILKKVALIAGAGLLLGASEKLGSRVAGEMINLLAGKEVLGKIEVEMPKENDNNKG